MDQYQVVVEAREHRLFATEWVTGRDSAAPLTMAITARFEEPTFRITVAHRVLDITSQEWGDFVVNSSHK